MSDKIYITIQGKRKIEEEIKSLKSKRPKVVIELEDARAQGDLSENAEYHAARERLGHIDGRVMDLENKLATAEIIDITKIDTSKVVFGTRVKLVNVDTEEEVDYRIVGDFEAEPQRFEISINSPIARALIGKTVGDEVTVNTPGGKKEFEIIEINK